MGFWFWLFGTKQSGFSVSPLVWYCLYHGFADDCDSPFRPRSLASLNTWPAVSGLTSVFLQVSVRAVWPTKMINRCPMDSSFLLVSYRRPDLTILEGCYSAESDVCNLVFRISVVFRGVLKRLRRWTSLGAFQKQPERDQLSQTLFPGSSEVQGNIHCVSWHPYMRT